MVVRRLCECYHGFNKEDAFQYEISCSRNLARLKGQFDIINSDLLLKIIH